MTHGAMQGTETVGLVAALHPPEGQALRTALLESRQRWRDLAIFSLGDL